MLSYNDDAIDAANEGRHTPKWVLHNGERIAKLRYVHTDAWRGHYDVVPTKRAGYKLLEEDCGWVTGDWDDAPEENKSSNVKAKIEELEERFKEVVVVLTPTSNVFSTSYDVLVKED